MNKLNQIHWPLILGLGALALVRPFLQSIGALDYLGRGLGSILVTLAISAIWLVIVVFVNIQEPILTLVCTGIAYGVFAIVIGAVVSPTPATANTVAIVSVLISNAIWGFVVGLIALGLQQRIRSSHD